MPTNPTYFDIELLEFEIGIRDFICCYVSLAFLMIGSSTLMALLKSSRAEAMIVDSLFEISEVCSNSLATFKLQTRKSWAKYISFNLSTPINPNKFFCRTSKSANVAKKSSFNPKNICYNQIKMSHLANLDGTFQILKLDLVLFSPLLLLSTADL